MWAQSTENGDELYSSTPHCTTGLSMFRANKRARPASQSPYDRPLLHDSGDPGRSTDTDASSNYAYHQHHSPVSDFNFCGRTRPNYQPQSKVLHTSPSGNFFDPHRVPWSVPPARPPETWRPNQGGEVHASITSIPPATTATSIVDTLLLYRIEGGESASFSRIAIGSLMKKLQDHEDKRNNLIAAITTRGYQASDCVPIQKTLDGRLQIDGKKVFPHVIYARIWRWPNVKINDLRHLPHCHYGFHLQLNLVCVNPYHYKRIRTLAINTLDNSTQDNTQNLTRPWESTSHETVLPQTFHSHHALNPIVDYPCSTSSGESRTFDSDPQQDHTTQTASDTMHTLPHPHTTSIGYSSWNNGFPHPQTSYTTFPVNMSHTSDPSSHLAEEHYLEELYIPQVDISTFQTFSSHPQPKYWCSISYFEFDTKVGQTFKANSNTPSVTVDGYADMSSDNRFCLGALTNLRRGEQSKTARSQIGKGVQLEHRDSGDIWLRSLSYQRVFVESCHLDREAGNTQGFSAHEIKPSIYIKIFDLKEFYTGIVQKSPIILAAADIRPDDQHTCGIPLGFIFENGISADDNRRFCTLRISFVEEWGPELGRKSIEETPCWVEVHLHRPLQLLDQVLRTMSSQLSVRNKLSRMNPQSSLDIVDTDSD